MCLLCYFRYHGRDPQYVCMCCTELNEIGMNYFKGKLNFGNYKINHTSLFITSPLLQIYRAFRYHLNMIITFLFMLVCLEISTIPWIGTNKNNPLKSERMDLSQKKKLV